MICVTRRYRFPAAHVLYRRDFSPEQNQRVYGKCANPNGHGHNYGLEITVGGEVDPVSGAVVSVAALDAFVQKSVLDRFAHRSLNADALFQTVVPTAENIAQAIHGLLAESLEKGTGAKLFAVRVVETARNDAAVESVVEGASRAVMS